MESSYTSKVDDAVAKIAGKTGVSADAVRAVLAHLGIDHVAKAADFDADSVKLSIGQVMQ